MPWMVGVVQLSSRSTEKSESSNGRTWRSRKYPHGVGTKRFDVVEWMAASPLDLLIFRPSFVRKP